MGFKISAYTIEDNITKNDLVKECVAVAVKDEFEEHVPMAYVVLKDSPKNDEKTKEQLFDYCKHTLKEYEIPKYIKLVKELPYTQNGKYNFRMLEELGNEYVDSVSKEDSFQRIKKN
jgi:acyl-coenzyme A synthetase/AMP-(fatty) acid ligase